MVDLRKCVEKETYINSCHKELNLEGQELHRFHLDHLPLQYRPKTDEFDKLKALDKESYCVHLIIVIVYLKFPIFNQLENKSISFKQFMRNGESSPSSTQSKLVNKILCAEFLIIFIHQHNCFIMFWHMDITEFLGKTLEKRKGVSFLCSCVDV